MPKSAPASNALRVLAKLDKTYRERGALLKTVAMFISASNFTTRPVNAFEYVPFTIDSVTPSMRRRMHLNFSAKYPIFFHPCFTPGGLP